MKSNRGITLIVLVITIIVLLVLAGVAIASLTGRNNITDRAQQAKSKSEEATVNEEARISEYEDYIASRVNGSSGGGNGEHYNVTIKNLGSANYSGLGLPTDYMSMIFFESGSSSQLIIYNTGEEIDVRFVPDEANDDLWYWWDYEHNGPWVAPKGENDEKIAPDETSFSLSNVTITSMEASEEGAYQLSDEELNCFITKTKVN